MNWHKARPALRRSVTLGVLLGLVAGSTAAQTPGFKKDVLPLFQRICVACHMTGDEQGNLGLMPKLAYKSLVNTPSKQSALPRVTPGDPERSYLIHKLRGTHLDHGGYGARMPLEQQPLSGEDMALLESWIKAGAQNN